MNRYAYLFVLTLIVVFIGVSLANMLTDNPVSENNTTLSDKEPETIHTPVTTDRGQLLYENHCTQCHDSVDHLRQRKKVRTINDIRQWVLRWSKNIELDWENNDIDVVTDYINRRYYNFTPEE